MTRGFENWTTRDIALHNAKIGRPTETPGPVEAVSQEVRQLHYPIMEWCTRQIPAVPFIRARSDMPSTIGQGVQDFTIFYKQKVLCIECKSKTGKQSPEQAVWAHLMRAQGFEVVTIRDMESFYKLVK